MWNLFIGKVFQAFDKLLIMLGTNSIKFYLLKIFKLNLNNLEIHVDASRY